jgi:ubiquinone/menaquinone biosynthesis C-methylase UbiE
MSKKVPEKCHCCDEGDYISGVVYTSFPIKQYTHPEALAYRLPCPDTYKCNKCDHVYRHYEEDVTAYHKSDDYRGKKRFSEDKKKFMISEEAKKVRAQRKLNQLAIVKHFVKKDDSLVDLGTGIGGFLDHAKKYYKNLTGTDIHQTSSTHNAETNSEINIIVCDILHMDESVTYDAATAFDVIEHVDDIKPLVNKIHKIVNKYFILQIPFNRSPYPPPNNPHHWRNLHCEGRFDGHVHYYTEESIKFLF